ncbi:hypothetical protein ACU639_08310 [Streptomyces cynarae]|uniref:hypothetical protein n=1 Tax=Streptomyces cynarae TaxID=2981134 RepID=UPI00406D3023
MSSTRPGAESDGTDADTASVPVAVATPVAVAAPVVRPSARRTVAALALVTAAALIPPLGPSAALHGTGEAAAPGVGAGSARRSPGRALRRRAGSAATSSPENA